MPLVFAFATRGFAASITVAPAGFPIVATLVFAQAGQGAAGTGMAKGVLAILAPTVIGVALRAARRRLWARRPDGATWRRRLAARPEEAAPGLEEGRAGGGLGPSFGIEAAGRGTRPAGNSPSGGAPPRGAAPVSVRTGGAGVSAAPLPCRDGAVRGGGWWS